MVVVSDEQKVSMSNILWDGVLMVKNADRN